jgi:hypothetical protein
VKQNELRALTWLLARTQRTSIDVSSASFRPADIERLMCWIRAMPKALDLNFKFSRLEGERLDAFLEGLRFNDNIRDLDLRFCIRGEFDLPNDIRKASHRVCDQRPQYERLCEALSHCKGLRTLEITIDRRNIGCLATLIRQGTLATLKVRPLEDGELEGAMEPLAAALSDSCGLTEFHIAHCPLNEVDAKLLFGAAATNKSLRHLSVIDCNLQGMAVRFIRQALEQNKSLLKLDLSDNPLGEAGAKELAAPLRTNTSLSKLVLRRCEIGDGIAALADGITNNSTLHSLDLANNPSRNGSEVLARALQANTALRSLNVAHCLFIDEKFIEALDRHPSLLSVNLRGISLDLRSKRALWRLHERKPHFEVELDLNEYVYTQPSHWDRLRAAIADETRIKSEAGTAEDPSPQSSTEVEHFDTTRAR